MIRRLISSGNDGNGNFSDIALLAGVAYDLQGNPQGSMGVDAADVDGDLQLDLFQTAYENQTATLYLNTGAACFQDATQRTGAGANTGHLVNWGTCFGDFDNDGDADLFVANGHIHDNQDEFNDRTKYRIKNQVFANQRGVFSDVSSNAGEAFNLLESSRAAACEDLDHDGMLDILILNSRTRPHLLKNVSEPANNWLDIELIGKTVARDAVGTHVVVSLGDQEQILEVHAGRGYQSHFGSRLHFGLGPATKVDKIEVRWPGSKSDRFEIVENVKVNQSIIIRQGDGLLNGELAL